MSERFAERKLVDAGGKPGLASAWLLTAALSFGGGVLVDRVWLTQSSDAADGTQETVEPAWLAEKNRIENELNGLTAKAYVKLINHDVNQEKVGTILLGNNRYGKVVFENGVATVDALVIEPSPSGYVDDNGHSVNYYNTFTPGYLCAYRDGTEVDTTFLTLSEITAIYNDGFEILPFEQRREEHLFDS